MECAALLPPCVLHLGSCLCSNIDGSFGFLYMQAGLRLVLFTYYTTRMGTRNSRISILFYARWSKH